MKKNKLENKQIPLDHYPDCVIGGKVYQINIQPYKEGQASVFHLITHLIYTLCLEGKYEEAYDLAYHTAIDDMIEFYHYLTNPVLTEEEKMMGVAVLFPKRMEIETNDNRNTTDGE